MCSRPLDRQKCSKLKVLVTWYQQAKSTPTPNSTDRRNIGHILRRTNMDSSREVDLKRLRVILHDPKRSLGRKRMAHKAMKTIVKQMKDRKLTTMRYRLVKAARAHDLQAEWKLTNLIRAYLKQERMEQ